MLRLEQLALQRPTFSLQVGPVSLPKGQRVTLIGPSGGGKSSLLRALVGLEPQAWIRGLQWEGRDLSSAAPHERPFGWLPQDLGLWPHLSALAQVAFARTRGASVRPVAGDHEILAMVGLQHRSQARPAELSGGERQRLAYARVVALQPAWAVLDEPYSQLDPVMATELSQAFAALAARLGMGLIQVTHQLYRPQAQEWFWVLESGTLTQAGTWAELTSHPASPWIARFVESQH